MALNLSNTPDTTYALQIQRVRDGGFLVTAVFRPGDYQQPLLATTTIDEALKYCKRKLETEHARVGAK